MVDIVDLFGGGSGGGGGVTTSVDLVASGAITAGDPVSLNVDGSVSTSAGVGVSDEIGTRTIANADTAMGGVISVYDPVNDKTLIIYNHGYGSLRAVVATVTDFSVSYGTPTTIATGSFSKWDCCYDPVNEKFVVVFIDRPTDIPTAVVGTVSGTTVSFGSPATMSGVSSNDVACCYCDGIGKIGVMFTAASGFGRLAVGTVSGASITFGTDEIVWPNTAAGYVTVTWDTSQQILFGGSSSNGAVYISGHPVSGDTVLPYAKIIQFSSASPNYRITSCYDPIARKIIFVVNSTSTAYIQAFRPNDFGDYSGDGPVFAIQSMTAGQFHRLYYDVINEKVVWCNSGSTGRIVEIDASKQIATSGGFSKTLTFSVAAAAHPSATHAGESRYLVSYADDGGNDYLAGTVAQLKTLSGNLDDYVGIAEATVADGETVTVKMPGTIAESVSGLIPSKDYYMDAAGDFVRYDTGRRIGRAITPTSILLEASS